jgi:hypothetical protein
MAGRTAVQGVVSRWSKFQFGRHSTTRSPGTVVAEKDGMWKGIGVKDLPPLDPSVEGAGAGPDAWSPVVVEGREETHESVEVLGGLKTDAVVSPQGVSIRDTVVKSTPYGDRKYARYLVFFTPDLHMHTHARMYAHTYTHARTHARTHSPTHVCTHIHTRTRAHAHAHAHAHTHKDIFGKK